MKNNIDSLNDHLFAMLEQVAEDTDKDGAPLSAEEIKQRIARVGAGTSVAREIINVQRLALEAARVRSEEPDVRLPRALESDEQTPLRALEPKRLQQVR